MGRYRIDPGQLGGQSTPALTLQPVVGAAPVPRGGTSGGTDTQQTADIVGAVLVDPHVGLSAAYDSLGLKVTLTNTDTGSDAVATHMAAVDPHDVRGLIEAGLRELIGAHWDGGGEPVLAPAADVMRVIPFDCEIVQVTVLGLGGTGSCAIDIWRADYTSFPPTAGGSITAASPPSINTNVKSRDSTLTGWSKALTAGDVVVFRLASSSVFTSVLIQVEIKPA